LDESDPEFTLHFRTVHTSYAMLNSTHNLRYRERHEQQARQEVNMRIPWKLIGFGLVFSTGLAMTGLGLGFAYPAPPTQSGCSPYMTKLATAIPNLGGVIKNSQGQIVVMLAPDTNSPIAAARTATGSGAAPVTQTEAAWLTEQLRLVYGNSRFGSRAKPIDPIIEISPYTYGQLCNWVYGLEAGFDQPNMVGLGILDVLNKVVVDLRINDMNARNRIRNLMIQNSIPNDAVMFRITGAYSI
jgi:hypothetical protein